MFKRLSSTQQRLLAERLRREATESRPAFCESLHHRILSAVREHHAAVTAAADGLAGSRRRARGLAAALAAACLLAAVAIGWRLMVNVPQQETVAQIPAARKPSLADLPSIDDLAGQTVGRLDGLSVSATLEPQATHLKHDARSVASVFLDRLPVDAKLVSNR